jgi:hypothetical protein
MSSTREIEKILKRGGDADEVLRAVLSTLHEQGIPYAAIRFVENDQLIAGPSVGTETDAIAVPVEYEKKRVGELALATNDAAYAARIAELIAPYVLVGWDTSGEPWAP